MQMLLVLQGQVKIRWPGSFSGAFSSRAQMLFALHLHGHHLPAPVLSSQKVPAHRLSPHFFFVFKKIFLIIL